MTSETLDTDLEFYDTLNQLKAKTALSNQGQCLQVQFADFLEPHLIKTGHILPLSSGHNACFTKTELTLYEIHLTNAGFISELT